MKNNILALETASMACSVALITLKQSYTRFAPTQKEHTQLLLPMVKSLLEEANMPLGELDAIAVGRGPGSFTGVRIAISAAQGLAFGLNIPVYPISTLEALCAQAMTENPFTCAMAVPALDARMHEVYAQIFNLEKGTYTVHTPEHLITPDKLLHPIESDSILALGSGWDIYFDKMVAGLGDKKLHFLAHRFPNALHIGLIAQKKRQEGDKGLSAKEVLPVYIRDKVTSGGA